VSVCVCVPAYNKCICCVLFFFLWNGLQLTFLCVWCASVCVCVCRVCRVICLCMSVYVCVCLVCVCLCVCVSLKYLCLCLCVCVCCHLSACVCPCPTSYTSPHIKLAPEKVSKVSIQNSPRAKS
jgi:hypothetical protein